MEIHLFMQKMILTHFLLLDMFKQNIDYFKFLWKKILLLETY